MAAAACAANSSSTSSSSSLNSTPPFLSPRKKFPTWAPRWRSGVLMQALDSTASQVTPRERTKAPKSAMRNGPGRSRSCSKSRRPSGHSATRRWSSLGQTRGDEVPGPSRFIDGDDAAVARAGQLAGAVGHFLQDGLQVEAGADAQQRLAQGGQAGVVRRRSHRGRSVVGAVHLSVPALVGHAGRGALSTSGRIAPVIRGVSEWRSQNVRMRPRTARNI